MSLSADKGNIMVIPDTFKHKYITALLKKPTYKKSANDPSELVEHDTSSLQVVLTL
jgi:hypothetical protein